MDQKKDYQDFSTNEEYHRALNATLSDSREQDYDSELEEWQSDPKKIPSLGTRWRLLNTSMLKGLVERTEHYNKNVDRKVMTDSRIAFEDEQLKGRKTQDIVTEEMDKLEVSSIPKRGRGDTFGKLRSSESGEVVTLKEGMFSSSNNSNNNHFESPNHFTLLNKPSSRLMVSEEDNRSLSFQSPRRPPFSSRMARDGTDPTTKHQFDPATAYSGKVIPNYRYSYNPQSNSPVLLSTFPATPNYIQSPVTPFRTGQRYPKRPENNPALPSKPKHLNHNYYEINLYGATQEDRIAQRIEKTVRQTEAPPRF